MTGVRFVTLVIAVLATSGELWSQSPAPRKPVLCGVDTGAPTVVVFVNGIHNTESDAGTSCGRLGSLMTSAGITGADLIYFYNQTSRASREACLADESATHTSPDQIDVGDTRVALPLASITGTAHSANAVIPVSRWVPLARLMSGCHQPSDVQEALWQMERQLAGSCCSLANSALPAAAREHRFREILISRALAFGRLEPDAQALGALLSRLLSDGRRVVVVSHSQGNLMVHEAMTASDASDQLKGRLNWVAVARPISIANPDFTADFVDVMLAGDVLRIAGGELVQAPPVDGAWWDRFQLGHSWETYTERTEPREAIVAALRRMVPSGVAADVADETIFVVDVSSSMDGAPLAAAIRALNDAASALPATAVATLTVFGGQCELRVLATRVSPAEVARAADGLTSGGSTPLLLALHATADEVGKRLDPSRVRVVVLSDGRDSCTRNEDPRIVARRLGLALQIIRNQ